MRKMPRQKRSQDMVEDISEAAIQLLDTKDSSRFTTNHVAQRAGVSIGSLYRYFPDKGAILRYVVRREIQKMRAQALTIIENSKAQSGEDLIGEIVVHSTKKFGGRGAAAYQIRAMIDNDAKLVEEVRSTQIEVMKKLHKRLIALDRLDDKELSDASLAAIVEAFTAAVQTLAERDVESSDDVEVRKRLLTSLLDAFSAGAT